MLIKNFDCNNCTKTDICKYKETQMLKSLSKVIEANEVVKINDKDCPPVIDFAVSCIAFEKQSLEKLKKELLNIELTIK